MKIKLIVLDSYWRVCLNVLLLCIRKRLSIEILSHPISLFLMYIVFYYLGLYAQIGRFRQLWLWKYEIICWNFRLCCPWDITKEKLQLKSRYVVDRMPSIRTLLWVGPILQQIKKNNNPKYNRRKFQEIKNPRYTIAELNNPSAIKRYK